MNPIMAGLAGVGTLATMASAIAGLAKKKPKIYGASGGLRAAQAQTQAAADKMASMGGLSETQYNRMLESGQQASLTGIRQAGQYTRENPFMSSAAAERVAQEMFDKSTNIMQKVGSDALIADIEKAEQNLSKSGELYSRSAAMAEDIRKADQEAEQMREAQKWGMVNNFTKLAAGAASMAGNIYGATKGFGGGKDEFAEHWASQDVPSEALQGAGEIATGAVDVASEAAQPTISGAGPDRFGQFQETLYGDTTDASRDMDRRYKSFDTLVGEVDTNMSNAKSFAEKTLGTSQKLATFDEIIQDADRRMARGEISPEQEYEVKRINSLRDGMIPGSYEDKQLESNYMFLKDLGYEGEELENFLNTLVK